MRRSVLPAAIPVASRIAAVGWPLCAAGAALAQTPAPALEAYATPGVLDPVAGAQSPFGVLIDQAKYWHQQGRGDLALAALQRALLLDPHNAGALALSAQLHAERGDGSAAQSDLAQLRVVSPDDPRVRSIEQALRVGPIDEAALARARDLARQGNTTEAIERYRTLFHGGPPPDNMAVEYNQVLAGTEGGWETAKSGLAQSVRRDPQDARGQLAYATLLTYRPATRTDGIGRLAILANNPAIAANALTAWRQALDWVPVDGGSVPLYQTYLAAHPDDAGLTQRLTDARNPHRTPSDDAGADRQRGFDALQANRLTDAETAFQAALAIDAKDSDALGGLGLVRQRQGRVADARDLLERAIAAAPDKAAQWQSALNGAATATEMASARALAHSGQFGAAAEQLRAVVARGGDVTGARTLLADMEARSGDLAGAEADYRAVLASEANNTSALVGLAGVLNRRGRDAEAQTLLARAGATGRGQSAGDAKAQQLRQEAQQSTDPDAAIALFRSASAAAPSDPWIRLDLARALEKQGNVVEAQAEMAALTDSARPSPDALHAAVLFAMETNQPGEAAALAERIPAGSRGPDIKRLLATARFEQQVRRVVADAAISGNARQQLLVLAAAPDPDGARGAVIVRAFGRLGDLTGARQAMAVELATNHELTPAARLAYAGALMDVGLDTEAGRLVASVDLSSGLTAEQRDAAAKLRDGIAVRTSDRLNGAGQTAEAFDELAPALRQSPGDPDLRLALARLYQTARDPKQALAIAEGLLRRDPGNLDARRAAVDAAIELGNLQEASVLVHGGIVASPDDPRVWVMSADLARARGDDGRVLTDLRTAQSLRRQQIGAEQPAIPGTGGAPVSGMAGTPTGAVLAANNPFRGDGPPPPVLRVADADDFLSTIPGGPLPPSDRMSGDIAQAIATAQEAVAPMIRLGPTARVRTGSTGLDQLSELTAPLEASYSPGGRGRLTVGVTPTTLSNGQLSGGTASQQQFGTLVFGGPPPGDQHAQGVGLAVGYKYRWVAADIGTTPLGFLVENVVGGVEVSPELGGGFRLRATAERRPVTDSLLSFAGTHDTGTGATFGGVVRDRFHGQLEMSAGLANFYAGGGYSQLTGQNVASNTQTELGAGGSYPIYRNGTGEVDAGLDLVYFSYAKNLQNFTLGQGGYFSPQSYLAALIPLSYTQRLENLTWSVGGSVGMQSYSENSSPVFPNNADLQARLLALAATDSDIMTAYPSKSQSGVVGGAHGSIDYQVTPALRIGGSIRYDHAGDWSETLATVFARYSFYGGQ